MRPAPRGVVSPIAPTELPVVVARPIAGASTPEVRATPGPSEAPEVSEAPVSRMIDPVAEHAPLSGFAAAITSLTSPGEDPAEPPAGPVSGGGTGDRLTAGPPVQRLTADVEAPIGSDAVPDASVAAVPTVAPSSPSPSSGTVAPPLSGSAGVGSLPVVSRLVGTAGSADPRAWVRGGEPSSRGGDPGDRVPDAPTLGQGTVQSALAIQRAPLTGRTAVPSEPPVQRVEFLTPPVAAGPRPAASRTSVAAAGVPLSVAGPSSDLAATAPQSIVGPPSGATASSQVQRSREGSGPSVVSAESAMAARPRATYPVAPAAVQRSAEVGLSYEAVDPMPGFDAASEIGPGPEIAAEPEAGLLDLPAPATAHDHRDSEPDGPAVTTEPWVPAPAAAAPAAAAHASAAPASSIQRPSVQRRSIPIPAVPTALPSDPFVSAVPPSSRPMALGPTVAVGPPLPVQRRAAHLTEAPSGQSSSSSPLIVSRQVAANAPGSSGGGGTMSFAAMSALLAAGVGVSSPPASESGSANPPQPAETAATDDGGFTSVQLQSADTAPAPSEPAAAAPTATPPPAAAATPPTDLDEMARRLYEPLSARLRAELWLDRERSGVMSDA